MGGGLSTICSSRVGISGKALLSKVSSRIYGKFLLEQNAFIKKIIDLSYQ